MARRSKIKGLKEIEMKMKFYQKQLIKFSRRLTEKSAQTFLRKNRVLSDLIDKLNRQPGSVGLSTYEYISLYQMVRKIKPSYALECGTGKSTYIIAHAMYKNGNGKKLVTMEESEKWTNTQKTTLSYFLNHRNAALWFPGEKSDLIELIHSPTTNERHRIWEGSRYKNLKDYPYSFIMIDGPALKNDYFINMDLIKILKTSSESISA